MLSGPAETGKTWATLWRLDSLLRATPKAQAVLVRKLRTTINSTVLVTYQRIQALREAMGEVAAQPYGGNNPDWYDYANGARLWIGGMDNPTKVLSSERDWIYVNQAEELTDGDWQTLTTRATGRGAVTKTPMLFGDCNPGPSDHWIIQREGLTLLKSTHRDNPSLFDEEGNLTEQGVRTMTALNKLRGVYKLRLRDGLWVGAEGQFFEAWDEEVHVCNPFPIPADWPIWGAFDYGYVHNTAFGVLTRHDDTVYLVGEHVQNKWLPKQNAAGMDALLERLGIAKARLTRIVAGHDVFQQRGDEEAKTIADQYAPYGYDFEPAAIDRITGAAELQLRLGNLDAEQPEPATLKVFKTCQRTITTMPRMIHDPKRPEDVKKIDADADGQGGDDPYDMLRYGVMDAKEAATSTGAVGGKRPNQGWKPRGLR